LLRPEKQDIHGVNLRLEIGRKLLNPKPAEQLLNAAHFFFLYSEIQQI
jgi:hypothetical protein